MYAESARSSARSGLDERDRLSSRATSSACFSGRRSREKQVLRRTRGRPGARARTASVKLHSRVERDGKERGSSAGAGAGSAAGGGEDVEVDGKGVGETDGEGADERSVADAKSAMKRSLRFR